MSGQLRMKLLEDWRSKAFAFGREDKLFGRLLTTTFDMLLTVVRDGTGDEEESLTEALKTLSSASEAVRRRDGNQNSIYEIVVGLCESTASTIESILEERRGMGEAWSSSDSLEDETMEGMPPLFAAQDDQPCSSSNLQLFSNSPVKDDKSDARLNSMRADEEQSAFSIPRESMMATCGPVDFFNIDIKDEPFDDWTQPTQPLSYFDTQANRADAQQKLQKPMTQEQLLPKMMNGGDEESWSKRVRSTRGQFPSKDYDDYGKPWNGDFRTAMAPTTGVFYPCSQCPKKFPSMKSLRGHEHKHNGILCTACHQHVKRQNYADHVAQFCKKVIKPPMKNLNLKGTIKKAESATGSTPVKSESKGVAGEKFYCAECGKKCHNKFHLEYHMRTHTGELPYACPYCDTSLRSLSVRNSHIRSVHNMQPYECLTCNKQFERMNGLRQHLLLNEGHQAASERNDGAGALGDLALAQSNDE